MGSVDTDGIGATGTCYVKIPGVLLVLGDYCLWWLVARKWYRLFLVALDGKYLLVYRRSSDHPRSCGRVGRVEVRVYVWRYAQISWSGLCSPITEKSKWF